MSLWILTAIIALTLTAGILASVKRGKLQCSLRKLASDRQMHFSPRDQLRLSSKVAEQLPVPGAAYVQVSDLIYGSGNGRYRYVFTAEYTTGTVRAKKRHRRAASFTEPRARCAFPANCEIKLASDDLPLLQQYESLLS